VPEVPPAVFAEPPPVPEVPPAVLAEPPPAGPPPMPPSVGGFAQKPFEQTRLPPQSVAALHGLTQKPLMQGSRPHWAFEVQAWAPGGIGRQLPARQKSVAEQSVFRVQAATQRLATQLLPFAQSELPLHRGRASQRPELLQLQLEWQSWFEVHVVPGQPKVQSSRSS